MLAEIVLSVGTLLGVFAFIGFVIFCLLIQFVKFAG